MSEKTSNEMENLSLQTKHRCPRDLLQRFTVPISGIRAPRRSDPDEDPGSGEEIELNLGLSLGGRFGVDKGNTKLIRSSSIATILPVVRHDDVLDSLKNPDPGPSHSPGPGRAHSDLVRTSSLPVETEEEWRKRKELQSLRRLAAKRRRSEKQRNVTKGERDDYVAAMGRVGSSPGPCFGSDKCSEFDTRHRQRQGSSGSVGETSSSLQERKDKLSISSRPNQLPVGVERESRMKEIGSDSVEDMPCVFTQGDGPDGRVVEGILYKYGKGEKVKIMCVCHGSFLSPAEFVKHAGGTDIVHPLKHIVVKASPSLS